MKEPQKPYKPSLYEYEEKVEKKYIYSFTEKFDDEYDYGDNDEEDENEDENEDEKKPEIPISELTLDYLVSKVPQGINLNQIKIQFGYKASDMAYENHYIHFYYEVLVPAKNEEYKIAMKQYEEDLKKYEDEIVQYKKFIHQEEIKKMEETLAKLKMIDL